MTISQIKQAYSEFDSAQRKARPTLVRDTGKGIWGPSSVDNVYELFQKINLKQYKNFLDIGCGDGRVVLVASLFTSAIGIEFDKELVDAGNDIKKKLNLNAHLIQDDFYNHNFSKYDIIFTNPDTGFYNGMEDKLLKELNGLLLVYNHTFLPRFLKRGKTAWINGIPITEYTNPKK
ncbi:MAG TPA: class I SAM-dependent methyltransferase [Candidatus Nanoarchaeia archaeon]|nr:class I SAM-dependent methyltransferase [Candidatus Nanoarchaeia archaeon]